MAAKQLKEQYFDHPTIANIQVEAELSLDSKGNTKYNAEGFIQGLVDGARFPVCELVTTIDSIQRTNRTRILTVNEIRILFNLGVFYSLVEGIWNDSLWGSVYVERSKNRDTVKLLRNDHVDYEIVGAHRHYVSSFETTTHAREWWLKKSESERRNIYEAEATIKIFGTSEDRKYKIEKGRFNNESLPPPKLIEIVSSLSEELHFLYNEALPDFGEITPNELLTTWIFLQEIATQLSGELPESDYVNNESDLRNFCVSIDCNLLKTILHDATGFSIFKVTEILSIFEHDKSVRTELWHRPLVRLDNNYVVPIAAILGNNVTRLMQYWLKTGGAKIDSRGHRYEVIVREHINNIFRERPILFPSRVLLNDLKLKDCAGVEHQIDIIFRIGNTIAFGELKCGLFPSGSIEVHNYYDDLRAASKQVRCKQAVVVERIQWVLSLLKFPTAVQDEQTTIVPFILTNLPIGSGMQIDSIPIVDLWLIEKYLGLGALDLYPDGDINNTKGLKESIIFYSNMSQAASRLRTYLMHPPQTKVIKSFLKIKPRVLYDFVSFEPKPIIREELVVDYPADYESIRSAYKANSKVFDFQAYSPTP
jgi:hypothetical protein